MSFLGIEFFVSEYEIESEPHGLWVRTGQSDEQLNLSTAPCSDSELQTAQFSYGTCQRRRSRGFTDQNRFVPDRAVRSWS